MASEKKSEQEGFDHVEEMPRRNEIPKASSRFLKKHGLSQDEWRDQRMHWLAEPDSFEKRNMMFWEAAKKNAYAVAYEKAQERQNKLHADEWLVCCLIAEGFGLKEIAKAMKIEEDSVDKLIREIKNKAGVEKLAHITRWFFGLPIHDDSHDLKSPA